MKTSRDRWIQNRYRLIETGISRRDCLAWWKERYDRLLERSSCVAIPLPVPPAMGRDEAQAAGAGRRNGRDRRQPQRAAGLRQRALSAPSTDALAQAVSLDEAKLGDEHQPDGFGNECEGHCGV